ncbi:hypothetical protein M408DRAFT_299288 [Serendipita vermifera MAFF 305830]|uniref:Uncharacterized protein n=1 Tax=Serendipita vermifera MAFF 305830 TaxID=933852 RepID=A0A0C3AB92_SERVB|nr:hypothetical protein M408DRAFT_299288 [Serendipita vermifera MAFF 305830]
MHRLYPNFQGDSDDEFKNDHSVDALNPQSNVLQTDGSNDSLQENDTSRSHSANDPVVVNNCPESSSSSTSSFLSYTNFPLRSHAETTRGAQTPHSNSILPREFGTIHFYLLSFLLNVQGVAAKIDLSTLVTETRRLSMSGVLGLLDTDILFAESGTSQPEIWRIVQGTLGIGTLRVLSKICKMPCFEQLHRVHGIKPPESVEAREFWLRQEAWTEIQALNMGQEDTSYHRINQGSGPQGKLLWGGKEMEIEKERWGTTKSIAVGGLNGEEISQGTTDKWWMDRWQIEALAVASGQGLDLEDACNLLTTAYFGASDGNRHQIISGQLAIVFTIGTFLAAWYTNWSWVPQFFALSSLGYFVNWTASLRGWRFAPSPVTDVRKFKPKILDAWPSSKEEAGEAVIRIAVQSSGTGHLKGLLPVPKRVMDAAKIAAAAREGRYKIDRKFNSKDVAPYGDVKRMDRNWISFESQSSYYGLLVSVEPDNVARRSIGVLWAIVNGLGLLILGFGGSIPDDWGLWILLIYIGGILIAIAGRGRGCVWTLPEFTKVDFTGEEIIIPPSLVSRVLDLELEKPLKIAGVSLSDMIFLFKIYLLNVVIRIPLIIY